MCIDINILQEVVIIITGGSDHFAQLRCIDYDVSITMYRIIDDVDEYSLRMICVDLLYRQYDVKSVWRRCYNTHSKRMIHVQTCLSWRTRVSTSYSDRQSTSFHNSFLAPSFDSHDIPMALNGIVDDVTEYSLRIICVDLLDRQCDVQVYGVGVTTPTLILTLNECNWRGRIIR